MLIRSLVLKIYLFAFIALLVIFGSSLLTGRLLVDQSRRETFRQIGIDQSLFIGRELAASIPAHSTAPRRPDAQRMAELSRALHTRLSFVPWSESGAYPAALKEHQIVRANNADHPARQLVRSYWVRLTSAGQPVGALRIESQLPRPSHQNKPLLVAGFIMVIAGLVTIPPLIVWVIRPLRRMVAVAQRLSEGDFQKPVKVDRRDEFGELERSFEALRLRIQQMLAQRDRLLSDISHELKGPLSRMTIALALVRINIDDPEPAKARSYLDEAEHQVNLLEDLINELLAFARGKFPEGRSPTSLELASLASEAIEQRRMQWQQKSLVMECQFTPATVIGDRHLLVRAIGNLLDNAIKYSPAGERITIVVGIAEHDAALRVTDNGPGIPEFELPHIFEPFYRPDVARTRGTGGVGLGLAIVQAIIESHGGTVWLKSAPGNGTTAQLLLPAQLKT
ncbi:MAG: HAMP domain-containing protein [Cyanobacteria bacterium NC_groundwater_1444_Ag_S-0.65um_54_12]|nr:HAMP domain-containing protein [Cyanobacteria bacterium NC_groundwater_1444_Ag_S-0.65um_54_12]